MSNREIAWHLANQIAAFYTPPPAKIGPGPQDLNETLGSKGGYIDENGIVRSRTMTDEEKAQKEATFESNQPGVIAALTELHIFLVDNFPLGELTEDELTELIAETKGMLQEKIAIDDLSDKCFPMAVIRFVLKDLRVPIGATPEWTKFTTQYNKVVMAK